MAEQPQPGEGAIFNFIGNLAWVFVLIGAEELFVSRRIWSGLIAWTLALTAYWVVQRWPQINALVQFQIERFRISPRTVATTLVALLIATGAFIAVRKYRTAPAQPARKPILYAQRSGITFPIPLEITDTSDPAVLVQETALEKEGETLRNDILREQKLSPTQYAVDLDDRVIKPIGEYDGPATFPVIGSSSIPCEAKDWANVVVNSFRAKGPHRTENGPGREVRHYDGYGPVAFLEVDWRTSLAATAELERSDATSQAPTIPIKLGWMRLKRDMRITDIVVLAYRCSWADGLRGELRFLNSEAIQWSDSTLWSLRWARQYLWEIQKSPKLHLAVAFTTTDGQEVFRKRYGIRASPGEGLSVWSQP